MVFGLQDQESINLETVWDFDTKLIKAVLSSWYFRCKSGCIGTRNCFNLETKPNTKY